MYLTIKRFASRVILMVWMLIQWGTAMAQGDRGSLTDEFPRMSAKERSRIAAKETEEAAKDGRYQEAMRAGELAFQEGRYEEAIERYEEARAMRPYNVYPKVKIEDLRALIASQGSKQDTASIGLVLDPQGDGSVPAQEADPVKNVPMVPMPKADPVVLPYEQQKEPPPTNAEAPRSAVGATSTSEQVLPPPTPKATKPAEGIIERRYREGHAFVIERSVNIDGRLVKYKRVYHPYGQTFYFEDGLAVDERIWKARFPDR